MAGSRQWLQLIHCFYHPSSVWGEVILVAAPVTTCTLAAWSSSFPRSVRIFFLRLAAAGRVVARCLPRSILWKVPQVPGTLFRRFHGSSNRCGALPDIRPYLQPIWFQGDSPLRRKENPSWSSRRRLRVRLRCRRGRKALSSSRFGNVNPIPFRWTASNAYNLAVDSLI